MNGINMFSNYLKLKTESKVKTISEEFGMEDVLKIAPISIVLLDGDRHILKASNTSMSVVFNKSAIPAGIRFGEALGCVNSLKNGCGYGENCCNCKLMKSLTDIQENKALSSSIETNIVQFDGRVEKNFYYRIGLNPIMNNNVKYVWAMIDEISDKITAKKEIEEAKKIKQKFLSNMSHEMRTPLNGIVGITEIMAMADLDDEQKLNLQLIKDCSDNLLKVVSNLLDFSKIEEGNMEMTNEEFSIWNIVENIVSNVELDAKKKNLALSFVIDDEIPRILFGDKQKLQMILEHLVSNALKFTEKGGVRIIAEKDILNRAHDSNDFPIKIFVEDTGIGIEDENKIKLFKSFSQVDDSYTKKYNGTGLGLVIAKKLTEMMNGYIGCESKAGIGSTFYFTCVFENKNRTYQNNIRPFRIIKKDEITPNVFADKEDEDEDKAIIISENLKMISELLLELKLRINAKEVYKAELIADYIKKKADDNNFQSIKDNAINCIKSLRAFNLEQAVDYCIKMQDSTGKINLEKLMNWMKRK